MNLLMGDMLLLRNVICDVRLMDRVILKMRLYRSVWHCVQMSCRVRHRMQVIPVPNHVSVCGRMGHVINVSVGVVVLRGRCLC